MAYITYQQYLDLYGTCKDNQVLEVGLNEELVSLFSRALEIAEADKISSQQYLGGIVLHIGGMILSISKKKILEVGDVDQKIEQAKSIMNVCTNLKAKKPS